MVTFISKSGRKYVGEIRLCSQCQTEGIFRKERKGSVCKKCSEKNRKRLDSCHVIDSRGNKSSAVNRKCAGCGEVKIIRKSVATLFCKKCIQSRKKSCITDKDMYYVDKNGIRIRAASRQCKLCGEISVIQKRDFLPELCNRCAANSRSNNIPDENVKIAEGRNRRALKESCSKCNEETLVRSDTPRKTSMCDKCYREDRYTGIGCYRDIAYDVHEKKCVICTESEKRIEVHHIDQNRSNNDLPNLLPLCVSCHRLIHIRLKKGLTHDEAYLDVKELKK